MRRKHFYIVAYDIADDKRRAKVVKILEGIGIRVNFSVFECMLSKVQHETIRHQLQSLIDIKEDQIIIYPICTKCFAQIEYYPPFKRKGMHKIVIV